MEKDLSGLQDLTGLGFQVIFLTSIEEGGYLAICPILQGCHAEGETIAEAIENVEDVAHHLIELMREDGVALPKELRAAQPGIKLHNEILVPA